MIRARQPPWSAAIIVLAMLGPASCAAESDSSGTTNTTVVASVEPTPSATTATSTVDVPRSTVMDPSNAIDPGLQPWIDIAVGDLAGRLGVEQDEIVTRSAVLTVWRNGALGCPKPGMQYTQAQIDGAKIVLEVGGSTYSYHAGGSTPPFLCETE